MARPTFVSNKNYPHPCLAREGWFFISLVVALAILSHVYIGWSVAWFFDLFALFVIQFFRDPPRAIPDTPGAVLSPADGQIVSLIHTNDPYAKRPALCISVFMNVFNVHSNRISVDGHVESVTYFPGQFLNASLDKASERNERNAVIVHTSIGKRVVPVTLVQVAGLIARRILCYVKPGNTVSKGQRYGFIRFGSRVDVYLPVDAQPLVAPGDQVKATSTILALLPST
jgi:phosphatidylserine decarboxylase